MTLNSLSRQTSDPSLKEIPDINPTNSWSKAEFHVEAKIPPLSPSSFSTSFLLHHLLMAGLPTPPLSHQSVLYPAARGILKSTSKLMSPLLKTPVMAPAPDRAKPRALSMACGPCMTCPPPLLTASWAHSFLSLFLPQTAGTSPSQGFCTCCSLCLGTSFQTAASLLLTLDFCSSSPSGKAFMDHSVQNHSLSPP